MALVEVDEVAERLPRELSTVERSRVEVLIGDAVELITLELARAGRRFDDEVADAGGWFRLAARRAVFEMVGAAVLVGPHAGMRSATSTTGSQSDSVTFTDPGAVGFAGVALTDALRSLLGLGAALPRGRFPAPPRWPEDELGGRRVR